MQRSEIISRIKSNPEVDVLIIGAGINGAATFLDLALNNISVLLMDRGDFCSGASATSSHMAHGGIRYLENGEFRLVKEAVAERNRMIKNAPHLVKPLPTVIPIFKFWSGILNAPFKFLNLLDKPSERGALVIKIGLILYDSYTGKQRTVPAHQVLGKDETFKRFPYLNKDVKFSAVYYDGQILSPERLNTEIILEGEKSNINAMALNYAPVECINDDYVIAEDLESRQKLRIKPKVVVNAAGPWIDIVNKNLGLSTKYIGGTKGSHIIVHNPELREAIGNNEIFFENKDGRIVLLFPFFNKVIIGTSDLPIEDPDTALCTREEESYFIDLVKRVFPDISVTVDQIIFRFSGVRPLEYQKSKTTGQITRDHTIKEDQNGNFWILSMVGGKLTSFRAFAEQVSDKIISYLGKIRKISTESFSIGGGRGYPANEFEVETYIKRFSDSTGLERGYILTAFKRYGTLIEKMLSTGNHTGILNKIDGLEKFTEAEIEYLVREEKVLHLDDLILRRSSIGWLGAINKQSLAGLASVVARVLNWDPKKMDEEINQVIKEFKDSHGIII